MDSPSYTVSQYWLLITDSDTVSVTLNVMAHDQTSRCQSLYSLCSFAVKIWYMNTDS